MDALIDRATETAGKRLARHVLAAQLQWPALAALCLVPIAAYNYLLFHTVVELVSVIVACSVFVIAWNAYPFSHNRFLLFLGTGLLWVSALDLFHALVYKGMDIVPGFAGANAPTQFWIGTRYLHALVLLAAPLFLVWPLKRWWAMLGNGMAACAVFAWLVSGHFPDAFVEGAGLTPFKIYSEYAIVAILALSLAFLWQRRTALDERIFVLVAASTAFVMAGELAFTKYASVYGQANLAGHLFRIVAYWLIYAALVDRALAQPFRMMARAATTYDAIPDATIVVDKEGVIRQVNGAARVQTGLPGQEAIGRDCHALFHPASVPRDACPACRCIREGTAAPSLELEDATGGRWVEISLAPVARGEDVTGMVHVSRDITERHNAERDKEVLIRSLNERMKELRCLYAISDLLERKGRDLPEVLAQIAALLPAAFQFPDITVARIACGAVERATPGFRRTSWRLGAGVTARGEPVGSVEVCYLEERPACDEGPFFDEERQLIDVVAERLGRIIERVRAEEQVARLTRLYATLSQTNQSIIRATDRSALFEEICRIACESGGFASAWISVGGSGADGFSVAASRGLDDADRALLAESAGNPEGHVARVLRTGESWFTNDYANDSATSRWHREETARGIAGCAIVPLRTGGAVAGLFGLYTREAAYFDDAQLALLEEMASDVSFALDNLEHERRRREGERALRESEERYRQVGASVLDGLIVIDDQGKITDWNSAAARIFSYTAAEAVGRDLHELVALSRYRDRYEAGLAHFRSSGQGAAIGKSLELTARRRDGSEFPVELSIAGFQWKGRWNAVGSVRDITDRVLAQKKLRFATAVVERSPTVLFRYRAEEGWPVEYVSENVRQVGYEAEELLSGAVSLASLIHPDDLGRVTDEMARHCASGAESFAQEYRIVTKGGAVLWVDDQTIVERDPAGNVTHFQGVVTDVTERRRAQQAELEQFRLAEAFFNHSVSAIAILDRDFNFVRVNDAYARGARKDIGEFAGRNHFEMYPSDAKAIFEEVVRTRRPYETTAREFTYPGQAERGKTYWDWTLVPILDRQGEVEYLVFSLQEVTERKLAEERQRAAALYARSLIEASLDPLITISPEGKVTDVNRMTEEATGVARAELIGTDFADYFTEPELARTGYRQVLAQGQVRDYPLTIRHRTGRTTDVLYNATVYRNEAGGLQGVFAAARDITERKQAELALRKLNRSLATLSRCNEELVHATDEAALLESMCRTIVEVGGYRLAWVGYAQDDAGRNVLPMASAGADKGYLTQVSISWADVPAGRGPVGKAIRLGLPQVVQDTMRDADFAPWREAASRPGLVSVLALPLLAATGKRKAEGVLAVYGSETGAFDEKEIALLTELASDLSYGIASLRAREDRDRTRVRLEHGLENTIRSIAMALEKRDPYTAGHQRRVAELSVAIGRELGFTEDALMGLRLAASIHDIGKIYVPSEILTRPGRLAPVEFELIKTHAQVGYEIVKSIDFPWPVADMIVQHHERLDGSGYPNALKGDAICREARILAVADVVEAMASHRPYRAALGMDAALAEILAKRGSQFDEGAVDACISLLREGRFAWSKE